jgi:hypothetical protein
VPTETTPRPLTVSPAEARALLAAERTGGTVTLYWEVTPQPVERHGRIVHWCEAAREYINEMAGEPAGEFACIAMRFCPYAVGDVLDVGGGLVATVRAVSVARDDGGRWCWAVEVGARKGRA